MQPPPTGSILSTRRPGRPRAERRASSRKAVLKTGLGRRTRPAGFDSRRPASRRRARRLPRRRSRGRARRGRCRPSSRIRRMRSRKGAGQRLWSSRRWPRSMARIRSKRSKSEASTARAMEVTGTPRLCPTRRARGSACSPSCHPWVPAESTSNRSPRPASAARCRKMASPRGERQMLPVHTNSRRLTLRCCSGHHARVKCSSPSFSMLEVMRSPAFSQTCLSFG